MLLSLADSLVRDERLGGVVLVIQSLPGFVIVSLLRQRERILEEHSSKTQRVYYPRRRYDVHKLCVLSRVSLLAVACLSRAVLSVLTKLRLGPELVSGDCFRQFFPVTSGVPVQGRNFFIA